VFGGVDPSSGTSAMMETTRVLGEMAKRGQRPRRTLIFCAWDGEEVTLTGSTEWGEHFDVELRAKAVAYLNVDSSASGPNLKLSTVGSLAPMIVELTRDLADPAGGSLYDAWRKPQGPDAGPRPDDALAVTKIGSGSDHTVFINHAGVPVVDMTFDGPYGVYHSAYDSHHWVATVGDPGFKYGRLMADLWGTMALRLANAPVLPLDIEAYAVSLEGFDRALVDIPDLATRLDRSAFTAAVTRLRLAGRQLNVRLGRALTAGALTPAQTDGVNAALIQFERDWLHEAGIPGRAWFKHLLYAPRYTYAAMTLPGVTEAAEAKDWARANAQLALLVEKTTAVAGQIERAAGLLPDAGAVR
jgi:N-acetylated-alpha-linked acidic dipeptidase